MSKTQRKPPRPPIEKYKYRTNRTGYVVAVNGKRVCVRVDECKEI